MFEFLSRPIEKGIQMMRQGNFADARSHFADLVSRRIDPAQAHFNLAKCYMRLGDPAAVKEHFHKALEGRPSEETVRGILEVTNWKLLSPHGYFNSWPAFSPDGRSIVFVSARRDTNGDGGITSLDTGGLYLLDLATMQERCLVDDERRTLAPVFSPNGRKLAYLSARAKDHPRLYLYDLATGEEACLVGDAYRVKYHCFAPDGKRIVFSAWHTGEVGSGIYCLFLDSGKIETLVPGAFENTFPSVSPAGDRIIFTSWRRDTNRDGVIDFHDNSGIYARAMFDGHEVTVAGDRYNNTFPVFAPDSKRIAFLSVRRDTNGDGKLDASDNAGIYVFDLIARQERRIVDDRFFNKFPVFTPDGRNLVFISNWREHGRDHGEKDFFENKGVYVISSDGGTVRQVVSDKFYGSRSPVVSPKGDCVAYISWRKGTNRGLYLAYLNRLPSIDELHQWVDRNL